MVIIDESSKNWYKRQSSTAFKTQTAHEYTPHPLEQEVVGIIGYGEIGRCPKLQ
jgi:phosphoglycerate dehydrogenase-like enzyme